MGDDSAIEWTDATWNPITGCSKVSPGCAHCYAETLTRRFARAWHVPDLPWTPENAEQNVVLHPERLTQPRRWTRPRMIFVNSMSDLFHELVSPEYIAAVFSEMLLADQHVFQVLTKRPERAARILARHGGEDPDAESEPRRFWRALFEALNGRAPERFPDYRGINLPLPNVWLGTSIENRRFVSRADALRATPAAVRFISAEPLLGPLVRDKGAIVDSGPPVPCWTDGYDGPPLDLEGVDWLIVGGESGPDHRPPRAQWIRDLHTAAWASGTAFFFKQWGGRTPKENGRELDGRTYDEMPDPSAARSTVPVTVTPALKEKT